MSIISFSAGNSSLAVFWVGSLRLALTARDQISCCSLAAFASSCSAALRSGSFSYTLSRASRYSRKRRRSSGCSLNGQTRDYQFPEKSLVNIQVGGGYSPQPVMPPPIPGGTWKGDPIATCINAVRSRIQQDYGNRVTINLPPGAARVTPIPVGQLMIPVNGTGQFTPMNQPTSSTQYSCSIDKRFGTISSVNYSRPNVQPQPR
jgi:hypothetical protein